MPEFTVHSSAAPAAVPDSVRTASTVLSTLSDLSAGAAAPRDTLRLRGLVELDSLGHPVADAADTLLPPPLHAWDSPVSTFLDSPTTLPGEGGNTALVAWQTGLPPFERAPMAGYDSGVMSIIMAVFLLLAACSRHASIFIRSFAQNLFKPHRESIFDDHTISESRIQMALLVLLWVCEGAIAFCALRYIGIFPRSVFLPMTALIGVAAAYYLWQLAAYNLVGYTFGPRPESRRQWIKGFNASQTLLGLALVIPMLVGLFAPALGMAVLTVSVILYIIARCIFIQRGLTVFYTSPGSLLNFILYLCALEIAPVVILLKMRFLLA